MSTSSKSSPMIVLHRFVYFVATYTGVRAAFNRLRHAFLPVLQAAAIDEYRLVVNGVGMVIRVHSRATPSSLLRGRQAGMISVKLAAPSVSRPIYGLLCVTSHFGCGHLEIAFYEDAGSVVFHGFRDILKANARRLGPRIYQRVDGLARQVDEAEVLRDVARLIERQGLKVSCAVPHGCVALSVDRSLLHPQTRDVALETLRRKYVRLWSKVGLRQVHVPALSTGESEATSFVRGDARRPRLGTRLAIAAVAIHPAATLVLFYTLAMRMELNPDRLREYCSQAPTVSLLDLDRVCIGTGRPSGRFSSRLGYCE